MKKSDDLPVTFHSTQTADEPMDWEPILVYVYFFIFSFILAMHVWRLLTLMRYLKQAKPLSGGLMQIDKSNGFTNCSFFHYVFIDRSRINDHDLQIFLAHEEVHAREYHSLDKLLLMILKSVLWFNPFIYLYDKALEQTNEYEADAVVSSKFGQSTYSHLLLQLSFSGFNSSILYHLAKSPVKERIKMLFKPKSKNMKKLIYLSSLLIGGMLVYTFCIQIVYAAPVINTDDHPADSIKKTKKLPLQLPDVKQTDPYFTSETYLRNSAIMHDVIGKTLNGKITGDYKSKNKYGFDDGKIFESGGQRFLLHQSDLKEKLNLLSKEDHLTVIVKSAGFSYGESFVYLKPKQIYLAGKLIYQMPEHQAEPFLFEGKGVRYNDGKITGIYRQDGRITINVNANGFHFELLVDRSKADLTDFEDYKTGDPVRLRFVNEIKNGKKSFILKDWISISRNIRDFGVQNKTLFEKFYNEKGDQRKRIEVSGAQSANVEYHASDSVIISNDKMMIKLYGNAVVKYDDIIIHGSLITINNDTKIVKGIAARITSKNQSIDQSAKVIQYHMDSQKIWFSN